MVMIITIHPATLLISSAGGLLVLLLGFCHHSTIDCVVGSRFSVFRVVRDERLTLKAPLKSSFPPCRCWVCSKRTGSTLTDRNPGRECLRSVCTQLESYCELLIYKTINNIKIHTSALPDGAAAEPSKWLYNWFSTSRSRFVLFLFGCRRMAWKLTGRPYLVAIEKHQLSV